MEQRELAAGSVGVSRSESKTTTEAVGPITCEDTSTGLASGRPIPPVPVTGRGKIHNRGVWLGAGLDSRPLSLGSRPLRARVPSGVHIELCSAPNRARADN